ncbi:MAG TPA: hypothetical protein VI818_08495 [Candidatus Thermoplasmatota archaeon]|nr:hypothetical protein [Candidatus Thermoplasmatota archaeon]
MRLRWWLVLVLVLPAFAGCLAESGLTKEEAPLGPRSLAVPPMRYGDHVIQAYNVTGHANVGRHNETTDRFELALVKESDHEKRTLRIRPSSTELDAFARSFAGVSIIQETQDLDVTESDTFARQLTRAVFEEATYRTQYVDEEGAYVYSDPECGSCEPRELNFVHRVYPREGVRADFGLLSGMVLELGKTVSFNTTVEFFDGSKYLFFTNLTPIRSTKIDGERAFLVRPEFGAQRLSAGTVRFPTGPVEDEEGGAGAPRAPRPTKTLSRPPEPFFGIWYTSTCAYPVRTETRVPFPHDYAWYWSNTTVETSRCAPGAAAVNWENGRPLPKVQRLPGATFVKAADFHAASTSGLPYALAPAWKNLKEDATFRPYQDYASRFPDTYPFVSVYSPQRDRGAYTWDFWFGDEARKKSFSTRLQDVPSPAPFDVYQNTEGNTLIPPFFLEPLDRDNLSVEVVTLQDAARVAQAVRPEPDAVVIASLALETVFFERPALTATFARKEGSQTLWLSTFPVTVDLTDGGLLGFNTSFNFVFGQDTWPWTAPPKPTSLPFLSQVGLGLDPEALRRLGGEATPGGDVFLRPDPRPWT